MVDPVISSLIGGCGIGLNRSSLAATAQYNDASSLPRSPCFPFLGQAETLEHRNINQPEDNHIPDEQPEEDE